VREQHQPLTRLNRPGAREAWYAGMQMPAMTVMFYGNLNIHTVLHSFWNIHLDFDHMAFRRNL
jgi:hypothetical protein